MIKTISINGFRRFESVKLDGLGQINFILGKNNIGKTSILEAIYTFACGLNIVPMINIPLSRARYIGNNNPYWIMEEVMAMVHDREKLPFRMEFKGKNENQEKSFIHSIYPSEILTDYDSSYRREDIEALSKNFSLSNRTPDNADSIIPGIASFQNPISIGRWVVETEDQKSELMLSSPMLPTVSVQPYILANYIDLLSHSAIKECVKIYSSLKRRNMLGDVTRRIQNVFSEIDRFDILPYSDGSPSPISVIKKDGSVIPLYACGDGVQRWFYILGLIGLNNNDLLCIDEIDTGLHPDAQVEFGDNLVRNAIESNVQVFATTHNLEFIDNFLSQTPKLGDEVVKKIRIITLNENDNGFVYRVLSAKEAYQSRIDFNMELR